MEEANEKDLEGDAGNEKRKLANKRDKKRRRANETKREMVCCS